MSDAVNVLRELRLDLLEAEIRKRWMLADLDVDGYLATCAEIKSIQNAIFNLEARLLSQGRKHELLATRPQDRGTGEGNPALH